LCLGSKSIAIGYFACKCVEVKNGSWHVPKLLNGLKCEFEVKTMEEQRVRDTFFGS
jgi:hypothetical protein